ncbi:MAG: flagellar biosynthesis protein FlhF [Helicobacteraceae bacterium]|nr:flagellar biosynthesis protein FlhF [Helicobacteraceae bacterium]
MKILTYSGESAQEALKKAMDDLGELGDGAELIETRELQKRALGKKPLYEVVVGIDEPSVKPIVRKKAPIVPRRTPLNEQKSLVNESSDVMLDLSATAAQISKVANMAQDEQSFSYSKPQPKVAMSAMAKAKNVATPKPPVELKAIAKDISALDDKLRLIENMFWDEKSPSLETAIPPEFAEIYKLASNSGMNKDHLDKIMHLTLEHMPFKMRESSVTVKRYFQTILRKMVPTRLESTNVGKKVIMLVGPTGVGKTTSIAKLAARYSYLMQKKYKVGLVVLDTYRIGAVEQLMQYARMMKLGIETVVDPPEFAGALESLSYCDYILIDTMGSSPYDREKIGKIYECLELSEGKFNIDTTLVLPSSVKYEDLKATYDSFSELNIDTMMFTKLDETRGFGNIFSLAFETQKPISYFSIGQEVPEDLKVASSDFLIECLLNGFSKGTK